MKTNRIYTLATLMIATSFASLGAHAAPRSTPVTVVNDATTPVPVEVISGAGDSYVYVGPSGTGIPPNIGHIGMNSSCSSTHPGSRMCSTAELIQSFSPSTVPNITMWVNPSIIPFVYTGDQNLDFSGHRASIGSMQCGKWDSLSGTGLAFRGNSNGGFIVSISCSAEHAVACCAAP